MKDMLEEQRNELTTACRAPENIPFATPNPPTRISDAMSGNQGCQDDSCDEMLPRDQCSRLHTLSAESSPELSSRVMCVSEGPNAMPESAKGLDLDSVSKVREAGNTLLRDDLASFLFCFYPTWQKTGIWAPQDMNTSILDSNRPAGAHDRLTSAYQLVLEVESDSAINNVKLSFARLILAREDRDYQHSLDQMKMQGLSSGKPISLSHAAHAQNQALQKIYGTSWDLFPPSQKKKEKQKLQRQLRCGRRIMELEAALGLGILLACNESIKHMYRPPCTCAVFVRSLTDTTDRYRTRYFSNAEFKAFLRHVTNDLPHIADISSYLTAAAQCLCMGEIVPNQPTIHEIMHMIDSRMARRVEGSQSRDECRSPPSVIVCAFQFA